MLLRESLCCGGSPEARPALVRSTGAAPGAAKYDQPPAGPIVPVRGRKSRCCSGNAGPAAGVPRHGQPRCRSRSHSHGKPQTVRESGYRAGSPSAAPRVPVLLREL